jgi:predicted nucleic acid-binding protein
MIHGLDTSFLIAVEVTCHAQHHQARSLAQSLRQKGDSFGLAPQVLAEFVHVVTDARRFQHPLDITLAVDRANAWWKAEEVERVMPQEEAISWFFSTMKQHNLGRKRVLDTLLAGTLAAAGIVSILTLNAGDFAVFGVFDCVRLPGEIL